MAEQDYKDYAPTLDGLKIVKADCDKVSLPEKTGSNPPEMTKENALAAIAEFPNLEDKGFSQIAMSNNLTVIDTKKLYAEFLKTKNPPEVAPVPEVKEEPSEDKPE